MRRTVCWFNQFFWELRFVNKNYCMSRTDQHAFFFKNYQEIIIRMILIIFLVMN